MPNHDYKAMPSISLDYRWKFISRIDKRGPDECWPWIGSASRGGYGWMKFKGVVLSAHRVAFYLYYGKDPGPLDVCHTCDNPPCCNPKHLFKGTTQQNVDDMVNKGRVALGESVGTSKLTAETVNEARSLAKAGHTVKSLAQLFGVNSGHMSRVINRKLWSHL